MTREQKRSLERIDKEIEKAKLSLNIVKLSRLTSERSKLVQQIQSSERATLREALRDYTPEERREATVEVVYAVATADILYSATMEVEEHFRRRFGVDSIPMMEELRAVVEKLGKIVTTIDKVGSSVFSDSYAEIVKEIETKYHATLKNYIHTEIIKSSRKSL